MRTGCLLEPVLLWPQRADREGEVCWEIEAISKSATQTYRPAHTPQNADIHVGACAHNRAEMTTKIHTERQADLSCHHWKNNWTSAWKYVCLLMHVSVLESFWSAHHHSCNVCCICVCECCMCAGMCLDMPASMWLWPRSSSCNYATANPPQEFSRVLVLVAFHMVRKLTAPVFGAQGGRRSEATGH